MAGLGCCVRSTGFNAQSLLSTFHDLYCFVNRYLLYLVQAMHILTSFNFGCNTRNVYIISCHVIASYWSISHVSSFASVFIRSFSKLYKVGNVTNKGFHGKEQNKSANKKVLLRERKRHTACRVGSARYAALSSGWGGYPIPGLGGIPWPGLDGEGYPIPGWGYPGYPHHPDLAGGTPHHQDIAGYLLG